MITAYFPNLNTTYSIYKFDKCLEFGLSYDEAVDWLEAYDVNNECKMYPDDGIYVPDDEVDNA